MRRMGVKKSKRQSTPLNIKDPEVYALARRLADQTGESMTQVVRNSLRDRLAREQSRNPDPLLREKLSAIAERCAARRILDPRGDDEILGYDEHGVPR